MEKQKKGIVEDRRGEILLPNKACQILTSEVWTQDFNIAGLESVYIAAGKEEPTITITEAWR